MAGISHDYHVSKLRELTAEVHKNEGKIVAQLNHGGIYSIVDRAGPSTYIIKGGKARAFSLGEIHDVIEAFGEAAERAITAGFDGVQIHGAHGYLISQFLSRLANRRKDEWGGNLKNRMRFLLEVYDAIRARVGDSIPVMLKINCDDFSSNGFTIRDSIKTAEAACNRGLHAIEVSGGGVGMQKDLRVRASSRDKELGEASFAGHAAKIRKVTRPLPLALVNGIRSLKCMEAIIKKDLADLISMSRPFIREPALVKRLEAGQEASTCTSCGICISKEVFGKMMLRCHLD